MFNWLRRSFEEGNGEPSSMRLLVFLIVICILANWTYFNITNRQFAPLDWSSAGAVIGTLLAKAYQKSKETGGPGNAGQA